MAEAGCWPSVRKHGLLSTTALLDLFEKSGHARVAIEEKHRPACVTIDHPSHGSATIRDQLPMSDSGLLKALRDELTPRDWYKILNSRVFFWVSKARLEKLLSASEYRTRRQTVIELDTAALLAKHADRVELSPYNSGATKPNPFARGRDTFLPISSYPFDHWTTKRSRKTAVVELTVLYSVPDVRDFVVNVRETGGGAPETTLFSR